MDIFNLIRENNLSKIKDILKDIDNLNEIKSESGESLLKFIIKNRCSFEVFKILVENGADFKEIDEEGVSLLDEAIKKRRVDIVKFLISKGIDPNETKRKSGFTPLMAAVSYGDEEITRFLLSLGVDITKKDSYNFSAKNYAKMTGNRRFIKILEEYERGSVEKD